MAEKKDSGPGIMNSLLNAMFTAPEKLLTGQTLDAAANSQDPLYRSFGGGSVHHAVNAQGAADRMGFLLSQLGGKLIEDYESSNPSSFPVHALAGAPQLTNRPGAEHLADPDTLKDMMANLVGGMVSVNEQTPEAASALESLILLTQRLPGISGEMEQKQKNLDTGQMSDAPANPVDILQAQALMQALFGEQFGPKIQLGSK